METTVLRQTLASWVRVVLKSLEFDEPAARDNISDALCVYVHRVRVFSEKQGKRRLISTHLLYLGSSSFSRTDEYQFSALIVFLSRQVPVTTRTSFLASQKKV